MPRALLIWKPSVSSRTNEKPAPRQIFTHPTEFISGCLSVHLCTANGVTQIMSENPDNKKVTIKERDNAVPGERIRAVGMCYYGRGRDLVTGRVYKLWRNPKNPKDNTCIELKENGQVKATINANVSKLLTPLIDNATIWESTWYG